MGLWAKLRTQFGLEFDLLLTFVCQVDRHIMIRCRRGQYDSIQKGRTPPGSPLCRRRHFVFGLLFASDDASEGLLIARFAPEGKL
jgi:hypothetical protein